MWRVVCATLVLLAGCGQILPERSAQSYYRFEDGAPTPAPRAQPIPHAVVVSPISSNAVGNAYGMSFSRASGERAFYQYNEWTDRPTLRVAQLLVQRMEARQAFTSVTRLGSGVSGDVLVNVVVDDVVHDLSAGGGGVGRISVVVEVVDRRQRRLLGRHTFVESAPAAAPDAAAGAAAINRALTAFLDEASAWIESVVETSN
ncbi:MAG TPA: ABC-type transport auxiliary lipoprotein family protein [Burkholderiaceae bacterium]|nr:ABC-type transport auxiliary lipoprotein family protein [Burkholderiaceae bacterium]